MVRGCEKFVHEVLGISYWHEVFVRVWWRLLSGFLRSHYTAQLMSGHHTSPLRPHGEDLLKVCSKYCPPNPLALPNHFPIKAALSDLFSVPPDLPRISLSQPQSPPPPPPETPSSDAHPPSDSAPPVPAPAASATESSSSLSSP